MQSIFFTSDKFNIEYLESGKGAKLLLLQDAVLSDDEQKSLVEVLQTSFTVICPDRQEWIFSGIRNGEYSVQLECSVLLEFMKAKRITYICGERYGAIIAMHLALRYPVEKLVLIDVYITRFRNLKWLPKYNQEIAKGNYFGAEAVFLKSEFEKIRFIPTFLVKLFCRFLFHVTEFPVNEAEQVAIKTICYEDTQINAIWVKSVKERKLRYFRRTLMQLGITLENALGSEAELAGLTKIKAKVLFICNLASESYVFETADYLIDYIPDSRKITVNLSAGYKPGDARYPDFLKALVQFLDDGGNHV